MEVDNIYTIDYILENKIDKKAYGFIYITTNLINGKKYIGQKKFDKYRWKNYLGSGKYLKRAINKYSKENFIKEIIAIGNSESELNKLEIKFIHTYEAVENNDYYNIATRGLNGIILRGENNPRYGVHLSEETKNKLRVFNLGKQHSEESKLKMSQFQKGRIPSIETKLKMSESSKGRVFTEEHRRKLSIATSYRIGIKNSFYGKHHTDKSKQKMSEAKKGHTYSDETKHRMSESRSGEKNYMYGKHQSEEQKQKSREAQIGEKSQFAKQIICTTTKEVFGSMNDAHRKYKVLSQGIGQCCKGKNSFCGKLDDGTKLIWMYYKDYLESIHNKLKE